MTVDWPDVLTAARIVLIPAVVVVMLPTAPWAGAWAAVAATALYLLAAVTDYADGYLARLLARRVGRPPSLFGRLMDPIADKMLVAATLLMLVAGGSVAGVHVLAAIAILLREIMVSGLREYLAGRGLDGLPVTGLAKIKTAAQMVAIVPLLLAPAFDPALPLAMIGIIALWIAAALTVVTGWDYVQRGLAAIKAASQPAG